MNALVVWSSGNQQKTSTEENVGLASVFFQRTLEEKSTNQFAGSDHSSKAKLEKMRRIPRLVESEVHFSSAEENLNR